MKNYNFGEKKLSRISRHLLFTEGNDCIKYNL